MSMDELKLKGRKAFIEKKFEIAAHLYGEAIDLDSTDAVLFSNRAQCYINLKKWKLALKDCNDGLDRNPTSNIKEKLLYRKALAAKGLNQLSLAAASLEQVLKVSPSNQAARAELKAVNSILDEAEVQASKKMKPSANGSQIPIEVVDSLPEEYAKIVNPSIVPQPKQPENPDLVEKLSDELFLDRPVKQQPRQPEQQPTQLESTHPFGERPAMLKLKILDQLLPDVRARALKPILELSKLDILELGDVEPEFLELFIDAGTHGLLNNMVTPSQLLERLQAVMSLARYQIALHMCSTLKINELLKIVESSLPELLLDFTKILS